MSDPTDFTQLVEASSSGDQQATDLLLQQLYDELKRLARAKLSNDRAGQTLQATALVHEAYLRLVGDGTEQWNGRAHFFGAAARAMRRVLVDRARQQKQLKRGGEYGRVSLHDGLAISKQEPIDVLALNEALDKLETRVSERKANVVNLRVFCGLSVQETAEALEVSPATVKNEWAFARAWLYREMRKGDTKVGEAAEPSDGDSNDDERPENAGSTPT